MPGKANIRMNPEQVGSVDRLERVSGQGQAENAQTNLTRADSDCRAVLISSIITILQNGLRKSSGRATDGSSKLDCDLCADMDMDKAHAHADRCTWHVCDVNSFGGGPSWNQGLPIITSAQETAENFDGFEGGLLT